jgi:NADH dehydrogenase
MADLYRVVIVGGGFGGLRCARALRRAPVRSTLVDRRNFHLFQPLLYQVATGALSPANIAAPLRNLLKRARNCAVLLGEAAGIDVQKRELLLADGSRLPYDSLVLAPGSRHHYFGHDEWERFAPGLKTVEDATEMRRRIFAAFEAAEREPDQARRAALLTFVVVGGGPTGVELAGSLAEIARRTMRGEFQRIDPAKSRIVLIEAGERLLAGFDPELSRRAVRDLERLGVEVHVGARVTDVRADGVALHVNGRDEAIATDTVLWGAGVQASPLCRTVAQALGVELDRAGRIAVTPECSIPGQPEIFVIGDAARFQPPGESAPLPGLAAVAIQQGEHVAHVIACRLARRDPRPFRYRDYGNLATIGKRLAVGELGRWKLAGTVAWLVWALVHVMKLIGFQARLLVLIQWAWYWVTWNRSARLITGEVASPGQPSIAEVTPPPRGVPAPVVASPTATGSQPRPPGSGRPPAARASPSARRAAQPPSAPPPAG